MPYSVFFFVIINTLREENNNGNLFLQCDTGINEQERILIFSADEGPNLSKPEPRLFYCYVMLCINVVKTFEVYFWTYKIHAIAIIYPIYLEQKSWRLEITSHHLKAYEKSLKR